MKLRFNFSFKLSHISILFLIINDSIQNRDETNATEYTDIEAEAMQDDESDGLELKTAEELGIAETDLEGNEDDKNHIEKNETNKMEAKVVGGDYAQIEQFPHSVFLMAYCDEYDDTEYWTCGSAVVNQRILITAAHCVHGCRNRFKIDAIAGSANYQMANVMRQVRRYYMHSSYNERTVFADIALAFLNRDLPFGQTIKRVIIKPTFPPRAACNLAGWGVINEALKSTTKLKSVKQQVWTIEACNKHEAMMRGTICASSGQKNHYPYAGDSGSALVTQDNQEVGLVSYRDDTKPELIIYTNVSYYFNWIKDNSYKLYCYVRN